MVRIPRRGGSRYHVVLGCLLLLPAGCSVVPRAQFDECQQLSRTLRGENARLKDQVLGLQGQNRDYADRAVDDQRRLAARDQAIERLERSCQAYQEERDRLGAAVDQLTASLGRESIADRAPGRRTPNLGTREEASPAPALNGLGTKHVTGVDDGITPE
jgi:hypothetical protein